MTNSKIMVNEISKYGKAKGYANLTMMGETVLLQTAATLFNTFESITDDVDAGNVPTWVTVNDIETNLADFKDIRNRKFPVACSELNRFQREFFNRIDGVIKSLDGRHGQEVYEKATRRLVATLEKYDSKIETEIRRFYRIMEKAEAIAMQADPVLAQTLIDAVDKTLDEVAMGVDHSEPVIVNV